MLRLIKGLIGLLIGGSYGVLIWKITSYTYMIGVDIEHPGPMIPDQVGMAQLLAFLAGLITGIPGALSGLIVGLAQFSQRRSALVGGGIGLLVQAVLTLLSVGSSTFSAPRVFLRDLLFGLLMFPVGVAAVSVVVSLIVTRIKK